MKGRLQQYKKCAYLNFCPEFNKLLPLGLYSYLLYRHQWYQSSHLTCGIKQMCVRPKMLSNSFRCSVKYFCQLLMSKLIISYILNTRRVQGQHYNIGYTSFYCYILWLSFWRATSHQAVKCRLSARVPFTAFILLLSYIAFHMQKVFTYLDHSGKCTDKDLWMKVHKNED